MDFFTMGLMEQEGLKDELSNQADNMSDEVIDEIEELIDNGNFDEAESRIQEESSQNFEESDDDYFEPYENIDNSINESKNENITNNKSGLAIEWEESSLVKKIFLIITILFIVTTITWTTLFD